MMLHFFASGGAKAIAESFSTTPDLWDDDGFRARHDSGLKVWVANGSYGLSYGFNEDPNLMIGGVTFWCLLGGSPSQHAIWRAYRNWRSRNVISQLQAAHIMERPAKHTQTDRRAA